jgi:hypothetical protein
MFNASVGWFDRFKNWVQLHNAKITGEAASGNEDATTSWDSLSALIKTGLEVLTAVLMKSSVS